VPPLPCTPSSAGSARPALLAVLLGPGPGRDALDGLVAVRAGLDDGGESKGEQREPASILAGGTADSSPSRPLILSIAPFQTPSPHMAADARAAWLTRQPTTGAAHPSR
jgi:hypothetical protein